MNYEDFADLSAEHEAFRAFLDREEARAEPSGRLPILAKLLEKIHHAKEEKFLFPLLLGSRTLEVGGPKCMTFFTPRVIGGMGWFDSAQALKQFLGADSFLPNTPFREEVARANSMLSIPIEDHMLGGAAMARLLRTGNPKEYRELFPKFAALLRDHIKREEECLLVLFRQVLTPSQKKEYARVAAAFDEEYQTAALLAQLAAN